MSARDPRPRPASEPDEEIIVIVDDTSPLLADPAVAPQDASSAPGANGAPRPADAQRSPTRESVQRPGGRRPRANDSGMPRAASPPQRRSEPRSQDRSNEPLAGRRPGRASSRKDPRGTPRKRSVESQLKQDQRRTGRMPRIYLITGGVTTVALSLLFLVGASYYLLPFADRPFHVQHEVFRPSGRFGLTLGIAGTALMVLNLTYLVRRQLIKLEWLGSLRSWMGFHVLTGLVGPALIVFHTAFAPTSYLGILALGTMLVVVVAGIFGRYIYAFVPRSLTGHELELEDVKSRLASYRDRLSSLGVDAGLLERDPRDSPPGGSGLINALAVILLGDPESRRDYRRFRQAVKSRKELRTRARRILPLARRLCRERQWLARYQELRALMGVWRFLHRWLAVVMLLVVVFHIVLALRFGDLWIFQAMK